MCDVKLSPQAILAVFAKAKTKANTARRRIGLFLGHIFERF